jgi:hypothetical protein
VSSDSILLLSMKYNPKIETNDYRLEIMETNGESSFKSYPIEFHEYIPPIVSFFAKKALNLLCICIILIAFSCVILLYRFADINKNCLQNKIKFWIIFGEIILFLLGKIGLLYFIVWSFKCCWLSFTTISILVCIILIFMLLGYLGYKKKKQIAIQ